VSPAVDEFNRALARIVDHVSYWTPSTWAASGASGVPRAEVVHALVQQVADLAADAESQPRRGVPRLPSDPALPDQLRVVLADLRAAAQANGAGAENAAAENAGAEGTAAEDALRRAVELMGQARQAL